MSINPLVLGLENNTMTPMVNIDITKISPRTHGKLNIQKFWFDLTLIQIANSVVCILIF